MWLCVLLICDTGVIFTFHISIALQFTVLLSFSVYRTSDRTRADTIIRSMQIQFIYIYITFSVVVFHRGKKPYKYTSTRVIVKTRGRLAVSEKLSRRNRTAGRFSESNSAQWTVDLFPLWNELFNADVD